MSDSRARDTDAVTELPIDIATMRDSARILLAADAGLPVLDELDTLTLTLREHIHLLIPEVAQAAAREPKDSIPRYCALACVGEARSKLRAGQGSRADGGVAYTRKLARSLNALCDHWESLNGVRPGAGR